MRSLNLDFFKFSKLIRREWAISDWLKICFVNKQIIEIHTSHFESYFQIKIHITTYFVLLFLIKTKVYGIYKIEVNCSGWINNFLFVVIDTHAAGLAPVCSCTALCFRRFSQMRGKIPTTGSQSHAFRINVKDLTVFAILPFGSAFQDETWYCTIWVHIKTFSLNF